MRALLLRLYYVYTRILSIFYFLGYFIWYWRKPENAYESILEKIENFQQNKERYSSRRYDEKTFEKFKITSSAITTLVLLWLIFACISLEAAFIFLISAILLALIISLIILMITL